MSRGTRCAVSRRYVPTKSTLFCNLSGNKMIDTINTERYSIVTSKTVVIRQSSTGINPSGIQQVGSGFTSGVEVVSRPTKIVSMWIPGKKFGKGGKITYENASSNPKFFDYHLLVYSYSNYDTTGTFFVGRVNDEVVRLFYKDA